jgi:sulfoxide reductase heme-binding subunit YedZ
MSPNSRKRIQRRLIKHHFPLLVLSAGSVTILYFTRPYQDVLSRASFATAYPALALLAFTLLVGPWSSYGIAGTRCRATSGGTSAFGQAC